MFLLVDAGCEGEECTIDQVCTFGNGTQEGLCTECSCIEGYRGTACASETKLKLREILYASHFASADQLDDMRSWFTGYYYTHGVVYNRPLGLCPGALP